MDCRKKKNETRLDRVKPLLYFLHRLCARDAKMIS